MSDLSPEAQALFRDAKQAYSPDEAQLSAVQASLAARIAGASGAGVSASPLAKGALSKAGVSSVLGGPTGLSLAFGGLLALAVGGVALRSSHAPAAGGQAPSAVAAAPALPLAPAVSAGGAVVPTAPVASAGNPAAALDVSSLPVAKERAFPRARADAAHAHRHASASMPLAGESVATPVVNPAPPVAASPMAPALAPAPVAAAAAAPPIEAVAPPAAAPRDVDTLAQEVGLLRGARAALDRGDAARALALLDQHAASFPNGILKEERLATRVLALCGAGRVDEAKGAARAFQREAPRSPHLGRLRGSCAGPALQGAAGE